MAKRPRKRPTLKRVVPVTRRKRVRVEPLEPAVWRVVSTWGHNGAMNMAIDEAIAESVVAGENLPTLRFYDWAPPCLSIGRTQSAETIDFQTCEQNGWHVVRRATGGRAVLHIDELTYSIAAPEGEPRVKGGVLESYRRLSAGLLSGLKLMGLEPERAQAYYEDVGEQGPACFDGPSDYEITLGQRKLIGSAQRRSRNLVMQHGSIPLTGDITRICDGLAMEPGHRMALRNRLRYRATTLASSLGQTPPPLPELAATLTAGFAKALSLTFESAELSLPELTRATAIYREKYSNDDWTKRK